MIGIPGRRAFNEIADALPSVAGSVFGVLPCQLGCAFGAVPIAHQLGFRLFERAAFVPPVGIDAVAIGGAILVIGGPLGNIGPARIVLAPVGILGGGVDRFGDRVPVMFRLIKSSQTVKLACGCTTTIGEANH